MEITIIVGLVAGLTESFKRGFNMDNRFVPLLSIGTGIVIAILTRDGAGLDYVLTVGIMAGLAASGLYDVAHKTIMNK